MKNVKKRIIGMLMAMLMLFGVMPVQNAYAITEYDGGYALSLANQTVYSSATTHTQSGVIYKNEGITVLRTGDGWAQIEYSTSQGAKQGYLYNPQYRLDRTNTCVAEAITNTTVYYGPDSSKYQKAGTVYAGEYVVAFGSTGGWAYIEYNTSSGRKRGYTWEDNLDEFYWGRLGAHLLAQSAVYNPSRWISGKQYVYAGPSDKYVTVGYVQDEAVIEYNQLFGDAYGNYYVYIEYYVTGTSIKKSGFIPA